MHLYTAAKGSQVCQFGKEIRSLKKSNLQADG